MPPSRPAAPRDARQPKWVPMSPPGLKGRFQRSQVRKHLVTTPQKHPRGLKGRFQRGELHEHQEAPCLTGVTSR